MTECLQSINWNMDSPSSRNNSLYAKRLIQCPHDCAQARSYRLPPSSVSLNWTEFCGVTSNITVPCHRIAKHPMSAWLFRAVSPRRVASNTGVPVSGRVTAACSIQCRRVSSRGDHATVQCRGVTGRGHRTTLSRSDSQTPTTKKEIAWLKNVQFQEFIPAFFKRRGRSPS